MIRCVAFDFDGTLVDSNRIKRQTFFDVVAEHDPGGSVAARVLDEIRPGDRFAVTREVARILHTRGDLPADADLTRTAEEWAAEYGRRCEAAVAQCPEIPGAASTLAWLEERDIPRYINSATPEASLRRTLQRRSMNPSFRLILGGPSDKRSNLERIRADAGCDAKEVLMVGDGEDDRSAAVAFDCPFVGVVRPGPRRFEQEPEHCIDDLAELAGIVLQLAGGTP